MLSNLTIEKFVYDKNYEEFCNFFYEIYIFCAEILFCLPNQHFQIEFVIIVCFQFKLSTLVAKIKFLHSKSKYRHFYGKNLVFLFVNTKNECKNHIKALRFVTKIIIFLLPHSENDFRFTSK